MERERFGVDHAHAGEVFAREAFLEARVFNSIGAHHGDGVPGPEAACVQAANAAVHLLHDLHADSEVLDAALAGLNLDPAILDDVLPVALPSLAPTVSRLAGRIAALERAATTDGSPGLLTRTAWLIAARERLQAGESGSSSSPTSMTWPPSTSATAARRAPSCSASWGGSWGAGGPPARLGGDALALWAALPADDADGLAAAVRNDVRTRFSADGVTVDVALGSAPARPGDDIAEVLHAAGDALERSRVRAARSPSARLATFADGRALGRVRRTARRARMPVGQPAGLAQPHGAGLGVAQRQAVAARARGLRERAARRRRRATSRASRAGCRRRGAAPTPGRPCRSRAPAP